MKKNKSKEGFDRLPSESLELLRSEFVEYWQSLSYGERSPILAKLKISASAVCDMTNHGKLPVIKSGMADRIWCHMRGVK